MENKIKYLGFIIILFISSCRKENKNVLRESFNIIFEENTHRFMNIAKTYECSNKAELYTILIVDVGNAYEIHKRILAENQKIDESQLIKLQEEIYKLAKKYKVSIKSQQLTKINDIRDNLLIINIENTLLKELEKKIHCDHPF